MKLKDFTGVGYLSGIDNITVRLHSDGDNYENVNAYVFIWNGNSYTVCEDPDDGWRSFLGTRTPTTIKVKNTFPPQKVFGVVAKEMLYLVNYDTQELLFELGSDRSDDGYPHVVMRWYPQNLTVNQEGSYENN